MTLVKAMTLKAALKSIAHYAFENNSYPVILTFENHVVQQQKAMSDICSDVLGDKLYVPDPLEFIWGNSLPSPNQLKGKFLIAEQIQVEEKDKQPSAIIDPHFRRLISLPTTKLGPNFYEDANKRIQFS